jgi:glycerol-3-phosphate dehydrogenase (NAD(P)+)
MTSRAVPQTFGVLGGGAFGTALAEALARSGRAVTLWARDVSVTDDINQHHRNGAFLPGVSLSPALRATSVITEAAAADVILLAVPAQATRAVAMQLKTRLAPGTPVVICAKGFEQSSGAFLSTVLRDCVPSAVPAVLSGPSFAADIVRGLPTALTLGCAQEAIGESLATAIGQPMLRLYWTSDITGVEIGGAVKNVLAIAAGIVDGRRLGASAHAALVTRGFAELRRFGVGLGARPETLQGLSGLGDLVLTCSNAQSRNMSLGRALGEGQPLAAILAGRRSVCEGVWTAGAVVALARARGIDMPIASAVSAIIAGEQTVDTAIGGLLARPFKAED